MKPALRVRYYFFLLLAPWIVTLDRGMAQSPPSLGYHKVQLKIENDAKYSRLFAIRFRKRDFQEKFNQDTIHLQNGRVFQLKEDFEVTGGSSGDTAQITASYEYQLIYLPENGNQPILLTLREVGETITRGGMYTRSKREQHPPVTVVALRDFFDMKKNNTQQYERLQEFVRERHAETNQIGPDFRRSNPGLSHVADHNQDYLNYARVHSSFPFEKVFFIEPLALDVTFSRLSFSSRIFSERTWLGVRGFGVDFGFGDRVLNLLSYQAPYLSWGIRFLIVPAGSNANIDTSFFIDLHIRGRSPVNTGSFIIHANLHRATPVFALHPAKLNVTSGVSFEAQVGRPFNDRLPFMSFYYSGGAKDFAKPHTIFTENGLPSAYFSTIQWEAAFSYFWNFDNASYNRMRLDIGAGSYNVWQVHYDSTKNSVLSSSLISALTQVRPLVALTYTHASDDARLGAGIRFFDNRLTLTPWIKVFESTPHQVRVEFMAVTRSVGRSSLPWEAERGSLLQLRYRFGFDENLK